MQQSQAPQQNSPKLIRDFDRAYVWHPWTPLSARKSDLTLVRGSGYRVWDIDGKEYIDASSLNAVCGYNHPELIESISRQLALLHGVDMSTATHPSAGLLAERLARLLPGEISRSLFVNSGSEGIEAAIFLAASYWLNVGEEREGIVAFACGYHGSTMASRSLTAIERVGHPFQSPLAVNFVDLPLSPRELRSPEALAQLLQRFELSMTAGRVPPIAVVVEPFLNVGGGIVLPDGFLPALRALCDRIGTLLILDEVFTAYGRCGNMFACLREGVEPDVVVSSKGLNSGYLPIAAVNVRASIYETFRQDPFIGGIRYGHTTSGHAVACAAALTTLDILERDGIPKRAEHLGAALFKRLAPLSGQGEVVDIRQYGLVLALEMTSADAAGRVAAAAAESGLLLRNNGEVIMVAPVLIIDDAGCAELAELLIRSIVAA
jgi:adenosylmethionine-8-amino-7-oxononanoate aminotransferase